MGFERRRRFGDRGGSFGERRGFGERRSGGFGERRSFGERRDFGESPVKEGEEYDVTISEVGSRGDGIARIKNFVVFVPNTKKGDAVKIKIKELRGRSAVGEVVGGAETTEKAPAEEVETSETEESESEEETEEEGVAE